MSASSPTAPRLPRTRQLEILAELERTGAVRVAPLASRFGVAEETIRRDLDKLGAEGLLTRTHGGAVGLSVDPTDQPVGVRRTTNAAQKRRIARRAAAQIEPGDVISLDASTTALELACLLEEGPLTVVTNGLDAARVLADRSEVRVIVVGGDLDSVSLCTTGPVAEADIRRFAIHKAFFSAKAVDPRRGCSEVSTDHGAVKRAMIDASDYRCLLADSSKLGVRSMAFFAEVGELDLIITDADAAEKPLAALAGAGATVTIN
ncbi:MAG: DeoR/GlpR family DNA-binding transcription regulator [Planctomycetota bacterium]